MTDNQTPTFVANAHALEIQALRGAIMEAAANAQYWHERWQKETEAATKQIGNLSTAIEKLRKEAIKREEQMIKTAALTRDLAAANQAQKKEIEGLTLSKNEKAEIARLVIRADDLQRDLRDTRAALASANAKLETIDPTSKRAQDLYKELEEYRIGISNCAADLRAATARTRALQEALYIALNEAAALRDPEANQKIQPLQTALIDALEKVISTHRTYNEPQEESPAEESPTEESPTEDPQ